MAFKGLLKSGNKSDIPVEIIRSNVEDPYYTHHDDSNWLVSYADMMTLLCGFFILLFSIATVDQNKFEKVKESVAKEFGGKYLSNPKEYAQYLDQIIQEKGLQADVGVRYDANGAFLVFQSAAFFDTLNADLRPEATNVLSPLIDGITQLQTQKQKRFQLAIEGHTDGRAILSGPYPSNWELSSARAARVVRAFIAKGYGPDQLSAIGLADTRPEATVRDPASLTANDHAKNRRVVIRIFESSDTATHSSALIPTGSNEAMPSAPRSEAYGPPSATEVTLVNPASVPAEIFGPWLIASPALTPGK